MRLNIVNPNTTAAMTKVIAAAAAKAARPDTVIRAVESAFGPPSIEGAYDDAFAVPGLLERIKEGEAEGADAHVIACFDDTGLDAARALANAPVVGIGEAGFFAAAMLAHRFSVVTTLSRSVPVLENNLLRYGLDRRCARVRACEVPVLELDNPASGARKKIADEIARALDRGRRGSGRARLRRHGGSCGFARRRIRCSGDRRCRSGSRSGRRTCGDWSQDVQARRLRAAIGQGLFRRLRALLASGLGARLSGPPQQSPPGIFPFAQFVGKLCRIRLPDGATNTLHAPDFDAGRDGTVLETKTRPIGRFAMKRTGLLMTAAPLAAALLAVTLTAASAQSVVRIGMTAADIPKTVGQPDQGFEGNRFTGNTMYEGLTTWDLSSADKASVVIPGVATEWACRRATRPNGSSSCGPA